MRRVLLAGMMAMAVAAGLVRLAGQTPPGQAPAGQPQPTFRVGATFVRVDAFITKNGEPVADLKPEELELREDGAPQTIQSFEYVNIPPATLQPGERRNPQTVAESREQAADPRKRVFVLFLDTYLVTQSNSMSSRSALLQFLQRMIGPDDLIAGMTPEMSAAGIAFGARTGSLEAMLNSLWGRRDGQLQNQEELQMESCFRSRDTWLAYRDRWRAGQTLEALEDLVRHLESLREERKAIIMVSEGWPMFRDNLTLQRDPESGRVPTGPGVLIGPGGRPGTSDERTGGMTRGECDAVRQKVASVDAVQKFRDLPDIANRSNASFYTVHPGGLPASDAPIDRPLPSPAVDQAILRNKMDQLTELAERTDGLAVQGSNDLTGALARVARDVSAYYLIGYDSTNAKLDGTYRQISLKVKRPGLVVRARRGYRAAVRAGAGDTAGGGGGAGQESAPRDDTNADVTTAVTSLASTRGDLPIRLRVTAVRMPGQGADTAELRVLAELDPKVAANPFWQQGATARIVLRGADGAEVTSADAALGTGERTLTATVPLAPGIAPGEYRVQVRLLTTSRTDSIGDAVAVTVPAQPTTIADPVALRRGPTTGLAYIPTADLRFRRQERLRLEAPISIPLSRVRAVVVDQRGQSMPLPVQVSERGEGAARLLVLDVSLAPLAAGGYAVVVNDTEASGKTRIVVPLQLVP